VNQTNTANRKRRSRTNAKTPKRGTRQTTSWKQWQRDINPWDCKIMRHQTQRQHSIACTDAIIYRYFAAAGGTH
jgi:hypothetical protein